MQAFHDDVSADPEDLLTMAVTEWCEEVGEEGEGHGGDQAHQVVTLWGLHLVTEAGALQQTDHLDQGVLLKF